MSHISSDEARHDPETAAALERFWSMVDHEKMEAQFLVDDRLTWLSSATVAQLRAICLQYRCFTFYYADDLALLTYRLPYGPLKSMMGQILDEELGSGEYQQCHLLLWDNFLTSIGVAPEDIGMHAAFDETRAILEELRDLVQNRSVYYAMGLRGMVGECLCQVYLTAMYHHLKRCPYMMEHRHAIDWEFWEIHTGEEDIKHRELMRNTVGELIAAEPRHLDELAAGYFKGKQVWDDFWRVIYDRVGKEASA